MSKKNIILSNINDENLLNGELNPNGVKIKDNFVNFDFRSSVYDCVYATLSVDSNNSAIEPQNVDASWKNSIPLNVFVRQNGAVYEVSNLVLPDISEQYEDRIIDKVFPFNEIKRVVKLGFRADCNSDNIPEEDGITKVLNTEYVIDYETMQSFDALDNQSFFNINGLHKFNDGGSDSRIDNKIFVKIPKFYFRTTFYKKQNNTYERKYEIISPEVYNSLRSSEKDGFFIPKGFNGCNYLYVSASPEADYNISTCFGSELNYIKPEELPINSNPNFSNKNLYVMTAEVWYGVICYLMRLYTGYINPVTILDSLNKTSQYKETNTDIFTSYFDYSVESGAIDPLYIFDEDDFSLRLKASRFIFSDVCYRFISTDFAPPPEGGDKNLKNLSVVYDNLRQLTITIQNDFQLSNEFDYCRYYITNLCYKNHVSDVIFPLFADETNNYGLIKFKIYSDYVSDFVNIIIRKTSYNDAGATLIVTADNDIFTDTDVKLELRQTVESEPTEELVSQFIAGRTFKLKLFTTTGNYNPIIIIATFNNDNGVLKSPKGMWHAFEVVNGVQQVLTDYNIIRQKLLLYNDYPVTDNAHYIIPYTHQTNDFYNCLRDCRNTFINYSKKNYKYKNHFSIMGFVDLFSDFKSSYLIDDYYLVNKERYRLANEETINNNNEIEDIFYWFNPKPTHYNKFTGVFISNLNMGSFSSNDIHLGDVPDSDYNGNFNFTINGEACGTTMNTPYTNTNVNFYTQDSFSFSLKHFVCDDISNLLNDYSGHYYYDEETSFYEFPKNINNNESAGSRDLNKGGIVLVCKTRTTQEPPYSYIKKGIPYYPLQSETNICSVGTLERMSFDFENVLFTPNNTTTFNMYSINVLTNGGNVYVPQLDANQPEPFDNATPSKVRFAFDQNILLCLNED